MIGVEALTDAALENKKSEVAKDSELLGPAPRQIASPNVLPRIFLYQSGPVSTCFEPEMSGGSLIGEYYYSIDPFFEN